MCAAPATPSPALSPGAASTDALLPLRADSVDFHVRLPAPELAPGDIETIVHLSGGSVPPRGEADTAFVVPALDRMSALLLGDHVKFEFESPTGARFVPGTTPDGHGFESGGAGGLGMASFTTVEPGRWIVRARADGTPDTGSYFIEMKTSDPRAGEAHLESIPLDGSGAPVMYALDRQPVFIRAFVVQGDSLRRDVTWDLRASVLDERRWRLALHDDGQHADSLEGDGLAVAAMRASDDERYVSLLALGHTPDGRVFGVQDNYEVHVIQDLGIRGAIAAVPAEPRTGQAVELRATVFNASKRDRTDFSVELDVDGENVSKRTIALAAGESRTISVPWTPAAPGGYTVKILVDPFGEPDDDDLANNWRELKIEVR